MTDRMEQLNKKREEVLSEIEPIMKAFKIKDYDYIVKDSGTELKGKSHCPTGR